MFENFVIPDLVPAVPEIFLAMMALAILLLDLLVKDGRRTLIFVLTQLTLLGCCLLQLLPNSESTPLSFSNMFIDNLMTDLLKFFVCLTVLVVNFYSRAYTLEREGLARGEYYVLSLFATLGMLVMISANHFVTVFLGVELLSLTLCVMVAMDRDNAVASEAAMKLFVLGALASGLLLYGLSMLYGATGSLEITAVAQQLKAGVNPTVLVFGLVFVIAGLAFKLGVVPFHMWIPDVYHGAPTPVTLFIGSAPKLAAFAVLINILVNGLLAQAADWQGMLMVLAVLSMGLGNIAAIAQTNIKRMLAYSAIAHMGFMLLGMVSGVAPGSADNFNAFLALNAYSSSMFYVVTYVLMSAGAFGIILLLNSAGFESDHLDGFKGLNQRSPWIAGVMLVMMFSLAGIPFFVGFFAKFSVLQAVVISGRYWLAILAVFFSLIGAFYYLRVVKLMYFDAPADKTPIRTPLAVRTLLIVNGLAVALLGLFPDWLMMICFTALGGSLYLS
ncbi:MAG: dehydrogenase subunit [Proteobacteria bacterium]|nr:dehydrogenase subunit [Pseudomonadota bacterium]